MHLQARDLLVAFPASSGGVIVAAGAVNFAVEKGAFAALLGPSGSGKSTIVRVFAGLQMATEGDVLLNGVPVRQPQREVAIMFQDANLMPWRTVRDNVALPLELMGVGRVQRYELAERVLNLLGLEGFSQAYPGQLSGGMAQRAAFGRVLIQKPEVLLLDEPFGALDALTRERIMLDLLAIWAVERQTVLMVTHDIQEAVLMADQILVLSRRPGRVIANFPNVLPRPRTPDMIYTPEFATLALAVREAIQSGGE
jgi:NitT/TauT family transport system ATP-binding protein